VRYWVIFAVGLTTVGLVGAQQPAPQSVQHVPKIYIAPMEWNLDRFVSAEIGSQGLPLQVVQRREEADFVMTSLYQTLGSHMMAPGHYIQVQIVASDGKQVWFAEVNDYALFFGRFRPHGPARAARAIVRKLHRSMSASVR